MASEFSALPVCAHPARISHGFAQTGLYHEGIQVPPKEEMTIPFDIKVPDDAAPGSTFPITVIARSEDGDEVYVLGFSRGAYTARSLIGMIRNCGLVRNKRLSLRIGVAYGIYRTRDDGPDSRTAKLFKSLYSREIHVNFLGVWDTVGALGIPLDLLEKFNGAFYEFHDTKLSSLVKNAYHAVAVDEHRRDYDATLWHPSEKPQQTVEQRWFVGAHSDVGGGYADRQLSDITLRWMQDKASALGLALTPIQVAQKNYLGPAVDSYSAFLKGIYAKKNPRHHRAIGATKFGNEAIDDSVQKRRREDSTYNPQNTGLSQLT